MPKTTKPDPKALEHATEKRVRPSLTLEDRITEEIVIAVTGPVGAGCSTVARRIKDVLEQDFKYTVNPIKVSDLIGDNIDVSSLRGSVEGLSENSSKQYERIRLYQSAGNQLRRDNDQAYLARLAVQEIHLHRVKNGGFKDVQEGENTPQLPIKRRVAHIIDSIKNPGEVHLLRKVYDNSFWCFAVLSPHEKRKIRLKSNGLSPSELESVMAIDENEPWRFGQKVRKTVETADFFIRNDKDRMDELDNPVKRFLNLIFGVGIVTPTFQEKGMAVASSAATASACLSRQVGAAVYSKLEELLGVGANDVPKFGGGLYSIDDDKSDNSKKDMRCAVWKGQICHNDFEKSEIIQEIVDSIDPHLAEGCDRNKLKNAIADSRVSSLIEFSRAVHAEMEAIVSVARSGMAGIVGGSLFSTTFPCHNCARHIVASGISSVYYIEAYPKSLALTLHEDSISEDESQKDKKCLFKQFEGVAPGNMLKLFGNAKDRKIDGKVNIISSSSAHPVADTPLDGFSIREQIILADIGGADGETDGRKSGSGEARISVVPAIADPAGKAEDSKR